MLAAAACHENTSPSQLTLAVSPAAHSLGIHQDSVSGLIVDTAQVSLRGPGAASARWTATHGAADWLTLVTAAGASGGAVRWVIDPTQLVPGTYVDTIAVTTAGAPRAVIIDSVTVRGTPAEFITVRRPWLPGEQLATILAAQANHTPIPYVGDISDLAQDMYGGDSVTVVVPNPLYQAAPRGGPQLAPRFSNGWAALGLDLSIQDRTSTPWDTLSWLGVMWWNPLDSTWKGWTIAATTATTFALRTVSTSAFDASGGSTGAGGGEAQLSTGTYWEASGGQVQISRNNNCGGTTTIASGVWKGGTTQTCRFGGRLVNLSMPRKTGTTSPATQTVNFDFRTATVTGTRITCVFRSPCTGSGAVVARLKATRARRGSS